MKPGAVRSLESPFTRIALSGPFFDPFGFGVPALNSAGLVAFDGARPDPDPFGFDPFSAIFLFSGGAVTPIIEGDFPTIASLGDPSLNNVGEVAFILEPTFGTQFLVTGPDPVADRVIGTGDVLFGRIVSSVVFGREGLNDRGQLAFTVFFDDGSSGVVLATPTALVPEPGKVRLVAVGLPVLLGVARRRRA
jgi:hypothetical protein